MSDEIKVGERVAWRSSGGNSVGRVKKKLTQPFEIEGHHVAASSENPELLVRSDTGGEAAHKPASIRKLSTPPKRGAAGKTAAKKPATKKKTAVQATAKK